MSKVLDTQEQVTQETAANEQQTDISGMDAMDPDLLAVQQALEQEDSELSGSDQDVELSVAETLAKDGKSTADVDGETVSMSQGAARRFSLFDENGDGLFSQDEVDAIRDQIKANNNVVGLKDDSDGAVRLTGESEFSDTEQRLDYIPDDVRYNSAIHATQDVSISLGQDGSDGVITICGSNSNYNHYEGVLGSFDYNPKDWAIGYKTVYDSIGGESVTTEIPILKYVGSESDGTNIKIPEGVKNLDYTFEGNDKLKWLPEIPDGVESMHCTFKNCSALTNERTDGFWQVWKFGSGGATGWKDRAWNVQLPDSVQDISYCFENCKQLEVGFETTSSGTQLQNMDGYARGCQNLTTILDVSEAKLLPVSAQTDAYDGINTKMIKSIGGVATEQTDENGIVQENGVLKFGDSYCGISMYANEDSIYATGKTETNPYSVDEKEQLDYVKAIQDYRANDRMYLSDPTAVSNATAGMATTATYTDENGQVVHTSDPTKEDAVQSGSSTGLSGIMSSVFGGDTGQLVQRLGFGFAEYSVLKGIVKNPLVALGITAGGQAVGVLPGTIGEFGKTLTVVGGLFGKDSAIGGMITKLGEKLSDMQSLSDGKDVMTKEEASNMNMVTDASQAVEAQTNTLSVQALSKLNDNMANRGKSTAEYGTFQEAAEVQEGYGVFNNVRMASEDSMAAFCVALREKQQADGGTLSEESKQELSTAAKQILQGWSTYGESASDAIRATYGGNPDEQAKGEAGLGKMMRAAVQPDLEILQGLNNQYQFLTEEDIAQLDSLTFKGLDGVTFSNYQPGANYAPEEDPYLVTTDEDGKPLENVYADYTPETYDLDEFMEKSLSDHDRQYRTENYVTTLGDGAAQAKDVAFDGQELGNSDITKKTSNVSVEQDAAKKHADRVARAEALLPSSMQEDQASVEVDQYE